jgi:hypothetical protein
MRLPYIIAIFLIIGLVEVLLIFWFHEREYANLIINIFVALGTSLAVLIAVYGAYFKDLFDPIHLQIEKARQKNNFNDLGGTGPVYSHHLCVVNATPHNPVINCRVWLTKIEDEQRDGTFKQDFIFAVPRLMEWAPSEYSKDQRTFLDSQVFDFGATDVAGKGFQLKTYGGQGGSFQGNCQPSKKRRYIFSIAADNFQSRKEHCVEVSVANVVNGKLAPAEIEVIK